MATAQIKEISPQAPPSALPKRGPGRRPKMETPPPAPLQPDDDETDDLPLAAGEPIAMQPGEWYERLAEPSAEEWRHMVLYLFRKTPITDRKRAGLPVNIQQYTEPIDPNRVLLDHGSGGYRLDWHQIDEHGKYHRLACFTFDLMNPNFPPKIPPGHWVDDPRNADWQWAKDAIMADGGGSVRTGPNGSTIVMPAAANPDQFFDTLEKFKKATGNKEEGGGSVLAVLTNALIQSSRDNTELARKANAAPIRNGEDPLIKILMDDRAAQREQISKLENLLLTNRPKSLKEELIEIIEIGKMVSPRSAAAAKATEEDGWLGVISKFVDHAPDLISGLQSLRGPSAQLPGIPTPAPLPPGGPAPAATAAPGQPAPAPADFTDEQKAEYAKMQRRMGEVWKAYGPLIERCGTFMVDQFTRGLTGYDFRDWFREKWGSENYTNLKRDAGPDILTALTQQHPQLKGVLTPPERVYQFFEEFFTREGEEAGEAAPAGEGAV
jgi:hypothetical protein